MCHINSARKPSSHFKAHAVKIHLTCTNLQFSRRFMVFLDEVSRIAFVTLSQIAPHMMNGSGSVVNLSSTRAYQSEPNCEAYDSSKAGLIGLTHAQAISLGPRGIRVNCVLPGWVESSAEYELTEGELKFFPIGRAGVSRDIAELCLFLLDGRKSGFITGQEFVIDGGVGKKMIYL